MEKKKKILKNIIMIVIAMLMIAALVLTTGIIRVGDGDMPQGAQGQPPQMQSEDGDMQVKELPDKKDEDASDKTEGEEPPQKPDGENPPEMKNGEEPPELPEGMDKSDMKDFPKGEKPDGMPGGMGITRFVLTGAEGMILSIIIMYLLMSGFNRKNFKDTLPTMKKKIFYIAATVVMAAAIFTAVSFVPMKFMGSNGGPGQLPDGQDKQVTELQDDEG